ncbi:hypothetical protein RJI07_08585 [Mycoplasmatota bacterium WC30]
MPALIRIVPKTDVPSIGKKVSAKPKTIAVMLISTINHSGMNPSLSLYITKAMYKEVCKF